MCIGGSGPKMTPPPAPMPRPKDVFKAPDVSRKKGLIAKTGKKKRARGTQRQQMVINNPSGVNAGGSDTGVYTG